MDACRVILIGMMGSGKSTIGRLLSEATGWPYVDNDELVQQAHGKTSRQLLAVRGEEAMRAAESQALKRGLEVPEPTIIGAAAGTILDATNRERLRNGGIVAYLRADAATLEARAAGGDHRPWLDGADSSWIREAVERREPLYESVADITVDTGSSSAEAVADELGRWLLDHASCRGRAGPEANPVGPVTWEPPSGRSSATSGSQLTDEEPDPGRLVGP
ncbi:MAG: shikimate kinase [Chloroflexi bacterium]|nr:shikimate kinase [Chloroflexota bacterium]